MGCGAKELGIFGDAAGVWRFLVAFRKALWNFPRQDHEFKEFRGFPGMELGIFKVAKSSGEGRISCKRRPGARQTPRTTPRPRDLGPLAPEDLELGILRLWS